MNAITRNILISLAVSLAFHLLLLALSSKVTLENMPGLTGEVERISETRPPVNVRLIKENEPKKKPDDTLANAKRDAADNKNALFENEAAEEAMFKLFENQKLREPPVPRLKFTGIERAEASAAKTEAPVAPAPLAPRPEIVAIDMANVPASDQAKNRVLIPKVERTDVSDLQLPSLLPHGPLSGTTPEPFEVAMRMGRPHFRPPKNVGDEEVARGVTGVYKGGEGALRMIPGMQAQDKQGSLVPFDDFVNVRMLVKDDPRTGGGYFVISIEANEKSNAVQDVPKDVLIAIDHSGSISDRQLTLFKQASCDTINSLKETDRFNVVTFTSRPQARFRTYVPALPENKKLGCAFVRRLRNLGTTSVYAALEPFLKNAQASDGRPLNIFLLTDGVSTVNIFKDDEFLRKVNDINPGNVSIFPISVGKDANQDLLDFLGFQTRGSSIHATSVQEGTSRFSSFMGQHDSLLIRNLEYVSDARSVREIYPRKLQHLYRNSDVKLYGKYGAGDSSIVLDIIGYDGQNQRRNMIFQCVYAECQRTKEPLESMWGARKILDLVSEKMMATDEPSRKRIDAEIREISNKYNLAVPY